MKQSKSLLGLAALLSAIIALVLTGCPNGAGAETPLPADISVSISSPQQNVVKGGTLQFTATVTGTTTQTVIWEVIGNGSRSTTSISTTGLLTVDEYETATALIVTATSTVDPTKSKTAIVTVTTTPAEITVMLTPATIFIAQGETLDFIHAVIGTTNQTVSWEVSGGDNSSAITEDGRLTVGASETADTTLTVTATSEADSTKSGTATVTVTAVGSTVTSVEIHAADNATSVVKGSTLAFTALVSGVANPAQTVTWTVSGNTSNATTFSDSTLTVASNETATNLAVKATSTVDTSRYTVVIITVTPAITSVTVSPPTANVAQSGTQTFSATVSGSSVQTVTWTISNTPTSTSTGITSEGGVLTVGDNEVVGTVLVVKATSTDDPSQYGIATVTVTVPSAPSAPPGGTTDPLTDLTYLPAVLAALESNTTSNPHTVSLAITSPFIDTAATSVDGLWKRINAMVLAAEKYVILDISSCVATNNTIENTIEGSASPTNNHFNIIKNNTYITGIVLPTTLQSIGDNAFSACSNLTSVTIPNITTIGENAFLGCSALTGVTIPNSVTSIGNSAFSGCSGLTTSVTIPNSVTTIGEKVFFGCSALTGVTMGANVTTIGTSAFSGCASLTEVTIGNKVKSIGNSAFSGCTSLIEVSIPGKVVSNVGVTTIGNSAFSGCTSLRDVTIGKGVASIANKAFFDCDALYIVTFEADSAIASWSNNAFGVGNSTNVGTALRAVYEVALSGGTALTSTSTYTRNGAGWTLQP